MNLSHRRPIGECRRSLHDLAVHLRIRCSRLRKKQGHTPRVLWRAAVAPPSDLPGCDCQGGNLAPFVELTNPIASEAFLILTRYDCRRLSESETVPLPDIIVVSRISSAASAAPRAVSVTRLLTVIDCEFVCRDDVM